MKKRGLSGIIATVLIILLVIVAVGIVWAFVSPFISDSISSVNVDSYAVDMQIKGVSIEEGDFEMRNVSVDVYRKVGQGDVTGVNFVLADLEGNTKVFKNSTSFGELETKKITFTYNSSNFNVVSISVAPIFESSNGKEVLGNVVDVYKFEGNEIEGQGVGITLNSPKNFEYLDYSSGLDISVSVVGEGPISCSYELDNFYTGFSASNGNFICNISNGGSIKLADVNPGRYNLKVIADNNTKTDEANVVIDLVGSSYQKLNDFKVTNDSNGNDLTVGTQGDYGDNSFSFVDFSRDLVLWMPMDEFNGNNLPYDLSSYSNDASSISDVSFIAGRFGKTASFSVNGTNHITIGDGNEESLKFNVNKPFTVIVWVKAEATDNNNPYDKYIISDIGNKIGWSLVAQRSGANENKYHRLLFSVFDNSNSLSCYKNDGTGTGGEFDLTSGFWHLIVGSFNGTDVNCFVYNPLGKFKSGSNAGTLPGDFSNSAQILVGRGGSKSIKSIVGQVDNVMIFNRSLSSDELKSMFVNGEDYSSIHTVSSGSYSARGYTEDSSGDYTLTDINNIVVL